MSDTSSYGPLSDADWPAEIGDLLPGFAGRLNVYRVMARHPALLRAWTEYRDHVVLRTTLGRQFSEVVILRTGHRLDAPYEWAHHVVRGRACGLDDARIASLRGATDRMSPEDATLASAVDELTDQARLSEATQRAVVALVGEAGLLDLLATVGLYSTLAFIVNSFQTPLDADIAEELARQPPPSE